MDCLINFDNAWYDLLPATELETGGMIYVPAALADGIHSVDSMEFPGMRLAVTSNFDTALRIAKLAASNHCGGYGSVLVRACNDQVTHTDPIDWLDH